MKNIAKNIFKMGQNITRNFSGLLKERPTTQPLPTEFKSGGFLTLGVEVELQVIDKQSLNLVPLADELLKRASKDIDNLHPEFYRSTLEIVTGKCNNVHDVYKDLKSSFDKIMPHADQMGLVLSTTGSHPFARYLDCEISDTPRYREMIDRNQWLTRRMTVYGLHVHIGMRNGDECMRFNNFFLRFVPHLLALSASSPFWQGHDTGLAAHRPSTYEALPTAGMPYPINSWTEFEQRYETLVRCGAIQSLKDLWWDIRPSPRYGTLEIRVCDGPASLAEANAIVAFIHTMAAWFTDHGNWIEQVVQSPLWIARENKWRAMRHGLNADYITDISGSTKPLREDILEWIDRLQPYIEQFGYQDYIQDLRMIVVRGNSSERQHAIFEQTGSLEEIVRHTVSEFIAQRPIYADVSGQNKITMSSAA